MEPLFIYNRTEQYLISTFIVLIKQHNAMHRPTNNKKKVFWIHINFNADLDADPDPGFWWPKIVKIYSWKLFLKKNCNLLIPAFIKDVQATIQEKPSARQKRKEHQALQTQKNYI